MQVKLTLEDGVNLSCSLSDLIICHLRENHLPAGEEISSALSCDNIALQKIQPRIGHFGARK